IVEALGRQFRFQPLFYWQPVIFDKPAMVPFEREEVARYAWCEWVFREVHDALPRLTKNPAFHDLSGLFADTKGLVFIDYCHTTEAANARIAAKMADDVVAVLRATLPADRKPKDGGGGPGRVDVQ